jgi:hypothetical protein
VISERRSCCAPFVIRFADRVAGFVVAGKESEEVVGGFAGLGCRADDGTIVFAQHLKPVSYVIGMPHGRHDAERGAAKGSAYFGDQLLEGVFG